MDKIDVKFLPLKVGKMDQIHFINITKASAGLMVSSRLGSPSPSCFLASSSVTSFG